MFINLVKNKATGLVLIQLFAKIFGFIREIIIVNFFGASVLFSDYLKLMTYGELLAIFYSGGGLNANLMRKFSLMHRRGMTFQKIKRQSIMISFFLFVAVMLLQVIAWKFFIKTEYNFTIIILISALTSSFLFFFNVGQVILLSKSGYSHYNKSNLITSFIYASFLYPLISLLGILGAPLNRFLSVISQYFHTWKVIEKKSMTTKSSLSYSLKDFNIWVFFTTNSLFLWYILFKTYYTFLTGIEIIYLTYGFILAAAFDGVIIKPFATYILERSINHVLKLKMILFKLGFLYFLTIAMVVMFGDFILETLLNYTEGFSDKQLSEIFKHFLLLLFLVFTNGTCSLMFQKVFSQKRSEQFRIAKNYVTTGLITLSVVVAFAISLGQPSEFLILAVSSLSVINFYFIVKLFKRDARTFQ